MFSRYNLGVEAQRVYFESKNLLITQGILVLEDQRVAVSSIATVTPSCAESFSRHGVASAVIAAIGIGLVIYFFSVSGASHVCWIAGALLCGLAGLVAWQLEVSHTHYVTLRLIDGQSFTIAMKSEEASRELANRISQAIAER